MRLKLRNLTKCKADYPFLPRTEAAQLEEPVAEWGRGEGRAGDKGEAPPSFGIDCVAPVASVGVQAVAGWIGERYLNFLIRREAACREDEFGTGRAETRPHAQDKAAGRLRGYGGRSRRRRHATWARGRGARRRVGQGCDGRARLRGFHRTRGDGR